MWTRARLQSRGPNSSNFQNTNTTIKNVCILFNRYDIGCIKLTSARSATTTTQSNKNDGGGASRSLQK